MCEYLGVTACIDALADNGPAIQWKCQMEKENRSGYCNGKRGSWELNPRACRLKSFAPAR
jgi:hypothetical protein